MVKFIENKQERSEVKTNINQFHVAIRVNAHHRRKGDKSRSKNSIETER